MRHTKSKVIKGFAWILCISFLISCDSSDSVVSHKRKYRKGYYWHTAGGANTKANPGKDSTLRQTYPLLDKQERKDSVKQAKADEKEQRRQEKLARHIRKDSINALAKANIVEKTDKIRKGNNKEKVPEPPDDYTIKLLILIAVLTGFSMLITGLITPIVIWGITQNFLLVVGVALTFIAFFISVNTKLGINSERAGLDKSYNIGKPSFSLSIWGALLFAGACAVVKTSEIGVGFAVELATICAFVAGACILLSLILAISALFVNDRHKGRALLALILDALVITVAVLLFL